MGVLAIVLGFAFLGFCAFMGIRAGKKIGKKIATNHQAVTGRVDTVVVGLTPERVWALIEGHLSASWVKDDLAEFRGYVYRDALTTSAGLGFGARIEPLDAYSSKITVFPYQRGVTTFEQVHIAVHGYGAMDLMVDTGEAIRSWAKIAPVRETVVRDLETHRSLSPLHTDTE